MRCIQPITVNERTFNCGRCYACRVNYTQSWALRLIYELSTCNSASFLTLTYNQENYPNDCSLHKDELQRFFKRLRVNLKRKYHEFAPNIRYYAVGEYGTKTGRCHYHAIVFGLDNYNDEHRDIVKQSWQLCDPWLFDKSRGRQSGMQEVTPDDIAYVTGYVQKKLSGELAREKYGDRLPPFSICSQGLGLEFALKNKDRLINNGYTFFKGHKIGIPRYFCEKFDVKKADLLSSGVEVEQNFDELWPIFVKDCQKKHIWNLIANNKDVQMRQFTKWLEDKQFAYANIIYKDFLQRQKQRGVL